MFALRFILLFLIFVFRSDSDTTSTVSDKENRPNKHHHQDEISDEVQLRTRKPKPFQPLSTRTESESVKNQRNKEEQESIALRKKTRKRTRKFVIDGVVFKSSTYKVSCHCFNHKLYLAIFFSNKGTFPKIWGHRAHTHTTKALLTQHFYPSDESNPSRNRSELLQLYQFHTQPAYCLPWLIYVIPQQYISTLTYLLRTH